MVKLKKKPKNKLTRHHIIPTSRGGRNLEANIGFVPNNQHQDYHKLFGNRNPDEIIDYLVEDFWNGRVEFVNKYLKKYQ